MTDQCPRCREELARLREENALLRRAADTFGQLAERLDLALQEERRSGRNRRRRARPDSERRKGV
jgi:anti-sigma factor RsiW